MGYCAPHTLADALSALAAPKARVLAGGTDVYPALGDRPADFDIVDISRIAALRTIERMAEGEWRIGAGVTWAAIARAALPPAFDGLKAAARDVGAIQIQNTATLAGNLCNASPAADGVPPLLSLRAGVEISAPSGPRIVPLEHFILGVRRTALKPGELVSAILIPPQEPSARGVFLKLGARRYLVISIAMVGAVIATGEDGRISAARIGVGACSAVAMRLEALEEALLGVPAQDAREVVSAQHVAPLSPIDDVRASALYRTEAALELVRRAVAMAAAPPPERRP